MKLSGEPLGPLLSVAAPARMLCSPERDPEYLANAWNSSLVAGARRETMLPSAASFGARLVSVDCGFRLSRSALIGARHAYCSFVCARLSPQQQARSMGRS